MVAYSINVSDEAISALISGNKAALPLLIRDALENESTLCCLLDHYCRDDRGSVDLSSIIINEEASVLKNWDSGWMSLVFQEDAYYGCRDMDIHETHGCEVDFQVDISSKAIVFSAPESSRPSFTHGNE